MAPEIRMKHSGHAGPATDIGAALEPFYRRHRGVLLAVYLFGSRAEGEVHARSDIDLAVLLRRDKSVPTLRFALHADLCRCLKREDIDLVVLNEARNLILQDRIIRNGRRLYANPEEDEEISAYEVAVLHNCIDFRQQRRAVMGV